MIPKDRLLTLWTLVCVFHLRIGLTWALTICETALIALVPLFIGFAIDGLLAEQTSALFQLAGVIAALIVVSVIRRIYDTRIFGTVRVEVGRTQATRASTQPVSKLNARLGMGRELVDFLEIELPMVTTAIIQIIISVIVLYMFDVILALAAICAVIIMLVVYGLLHKQFYRLNGVFNGQSERQVAILEGRSIPRFLMHLSRLRRIEVKISDVESALYCAVFAVLLSLVVFNLWYATTYVAISPGNIFSIVSYSWELVEAAVTFPMALQGWSRLSEIIQRLNPAHA
jgi:hypothetical protein